MKYSSTCAGGGTPVNKKGECLMKAVVIDRYGGPDELQIRNVPVPALRSSDVLIEVYAASVNPVDWKFRQGYLKAMIPDNFLLIPGWDAAGIVRDTGPVASLYKPGDKVFSRTDITRAGTYAEYVAVDEELVALMPDNLTFVEAAAVPLACQTAWQALVETAFLKECDKVLVHAGSGGVGSFAIQIAKNRDAYVATTCSAGNAAMVRSLGADEIIDYTKTDFSEALHDFDFVLDTVGGDTYRKSFKVLKKGGTMISLLEEPDEALAKDSGVKAEYIFLQPDRKRLGMIAELLQMGDLKVVVGTVLPLEEVRQAHSLSQSRHSKGKIVLAIKE
jgi:NADPH:quinone reductase-like Zn-dependent oxidoreductase